MFETSSFKQNSLTIDEHGIQNIVSINRTTCLRCNKASNNPFRRFPAKKYLPTDIYVSW